MSTGLRHVALLDRVTEDWTALGRPGCKEALRNSYRSPVCNARPSTACAILKVAGSVLSCEDVKSEIFNQNLVVGRGCCQCVWHLGFLLPATNPDGSQTKLAQVFMQGTSAKGRSHASSAPEPKFANALLHLGNPMIR